MSRPATQSSGFTLIELLVVIGIFSVLTGVILSNYRSYDINAKFANASEDIVLALRQAQVYGVGTKGAGSSFTAPYGVHFSTVTPIQMIVFADRDAVPDGKYTAADNPIIETINWGNVVPSLSMKCDGSTCASSELNITFKRPNPDAIIRDGAGFPYSNVAIIISNGVSGAGARFSTTTITNAGQISLQ